MSLTNDCLRAFCASVGNGTEEGDTFVNIRKEVSSIAQIPWSDTMGMAIQEYLSIPNHMYACTDLDYKRFSPSPLILDGRQLHLFHILEAFSKTNPRRYASVWLPLLNLAESVVSPGSSQMSGFQAARQHLQQQMEQSNSGTFPPNTGSETDALDSMVQILVGNFPGLQSMFQQLNTIENQNGSGGLSNMIQQMHGMLNTLLSKAAASAVERDPSIQPAMNQIIQGFTALTNVIASNASGLPATPPPVSEIQPPNASMDACIE